MAPLRYAAKFDPFLSLDCAPTPSTLAQSKERKGSNFTIWQPCAQSLYAGFYVGAYGLVANFSAPAQRAQRFARMDAISLLAFTFSVAVRN